jgi:hypothetical protein
MSAFGKDVCEVEIPGDTIRPRTSYLLYWRGCILRDEYDNSWHGSCFGMSLSANMYFDNFKDVEADFPGHEHLADIDKAFPARDTINKYNTCSFGSDHVCYVGLSWLAVNPGETVEGIRQMFANVDKDHRVLMMCESEKAHSFPLPHNVCPYDLYNDADSAELERIPVYANFFPKQYGKEVTVNTETGEWYSYLSGYYGDGHGLFLLPEASSFLSAPTIYPSAQYSTVFAGSNCNEHYELSTRASDTLFGSTAVGHYESHVAHILAADETWLCSFGSIGDSAFTFRMFTPEQTAFSYSSIGVDTIEIIYGGEDENICVHNVDSEAEHDFIMVATTDSEEYTYFVKDLILADDDSIRYSRTGQNELEICNFGGATLYGLRVERAVGSKQRVFCDEDSPVILEANSRHLVKYDWFNCGNELTILVDSGMTGSYSDTIYLVNDLGSPPLVGDANGSGGIDIEDVVYLINYITASGPAPTPYAVASGDANCSCDVDIDDVVYLIAFIFTGGPAPCSCGSWISECGDLH